MARKKSKKILVPESEEDFIANLFETAFDETDLAQMVKAYRFLLTKFLLNEEVMDAIATIKWNLYQSLIKKGFTEDQAFQMAASFSIPIFPG